MVDSAAADPFELAVSLHQAGRLPEAEPLYRGLLEEAEDDAVVLNLLGALRLARGDAVEARELLARSVALDPEDPTAWLHLAEAELAARRHAEALRAWVRAAALDDGRDELRSRLEPVGRTLSRMHGESTLLELCAAIDDAPRRNAVEALVRRLAQVEPASHVAANSALAVGDLAAAERGYRTCLDECPDHPESLLNLGSLLAITDRLDESEKMLTRAVAVAPTARTRAALATTLGRLDRHDEAIELLEAAIREDPDLPEAWVNLGESLAAVQRHDEAIPVARRAVELGGERPEAWKSLASALEFRDPRASIAAAEEALRRRPDFADAEMTLAQGLLRLGRFEAGWRAYGARWRVRDAPQRRGLLPAWESPHLDAASRLLVVGEQGVGDEVMFVSMLADLEAKVGAGTIECDRRIVGLLARSFPSWRCVPFGESTSHDGDREVPIADLARALRDRTEAFATSRPFLVADEARCDRIRELLDSRVSSGPTIGISWHSANRRLGPAKSIALEALATAVASAGGRLVDLQYDSTDEDRDRVRAATGADLLQIEGIDRRDDLDGLAALIASVDGVVSIDNTTIHLAGGLGTPAMVLLPHGSDWRWTLGHETSLWYPSVRIARQVDPGDWTVPLRAAAAFVERTGGRLKST